uniref:Uncharacterized protein n=1 Tax=Arundo donax TaxID=35708 RepID=A0A0A9A8X5_ARUDO
MFQDLVTHRQCLLFPFYICSEWVHKL